MNHAELSRELALALGYYPESVSINHNEGQCYVYFKNGGASQAWWWVFDYRDPTVALPLLKSLHAVTVCGPDYGGIAVGDWSIKCDTLEEAIARACIAVGGK